MVELSLVIPFYNEEQNVDYAVGKALKDLHESGLSFELICVDNGSTDNTLARLKAKDDPSMRIVRIRRNIGYGYGVRTGLEAARGEYIGFIDADFQNSIRDVLILYRKMRQAKADVAKGIRKTRTESFSRKVMSYGFNAFASGLLGIRARDINAKPKIFRRECFRKMRISSNDWFIDTEMMVKAKRLRFSLCEYPLDSKMRKRGRSHVRIGIILEFLKNIVRTRWG